MRKRNRSRATIAFRIYLLSSFEGRAQEGCGTLLEVEWGGARPFYPAEQRLKPGRLRRTSAAQQLRAGRRRRVAVKRKLRLLGADPVGHSGCG